MKKRYYAESTLHKKYRATRIAPTVIMEVKAYLDACANFYYILEMDEAFRIISSHVGISKPQFDTLLPVLIHDSSLDGIILAEKELFSDGNDDLYIVADKYIIVENELTDEITDSDAPEDTRPSELVFDWNRFYPLFERRKDKPLYVPDDLILYADSDYYESTPQTSDMERFLSARVIRPDDISDDDFADYTEDAVHSTVITLVELINDATIIPTQAAGKAMAYIDKCGDITLREKDLKTFIDLYMQMNNTTRMPINKGHRPDEIRRPGMPTSISFGSGIKSALQNGDIDADEMRSAIFAQSDWPTNIRSSMLSEIDKAMLEPGEERWIGDTVVKGAKVGPNDPCPCGSGKKYKKCCGR